MKYMRILLTIPLTGVLLCGSIAMAEKGTSAQRAEAAKAAELTDKAMAMTPEREAAALTFAKRHHPELVRLLEQLKGMDVSGYKVAITDLFRTSERLAKLQPRQPERYQTELELWKIDSRLRLLAARSSAGMNDALRDEMLTLLTQRNAIRLAQMRFEQDRLAARLKRLDETIETLETTSQEIADRELAKLLKSVNNRTKTKRVKRPADAEPVSTK